MGANLDFASVLYEGGDLDPPLYHRLVQEKVLPYLAPISEGGSSELRIAAILKESRDCYQRIFGTPTPIP